MTAMKKSTDKIVTKNFNLVQKKMDRLTDRMILSDVHEDKKEREIMTKINRLTESQTGIS